MLAQVHTGFAGGNLDGLWRQLVSSQRRPRRPHGNRARVADLALDLGYGPRALCGGIYLLWFDMCDGCHTYVRKVCII